MSVTSFNFLQDGTSGPQVGERGSRTYKITIEAFTSGANESGTSVISTPGLPTQYVSTHPNDPFAVCVEIDPKQHPDASNYWLITYTYRTRIREFAQGKPSGDGQQSPQFDADNPLNRPPKIRHYTKMVKRPVFADLDGNPYVTTAGELYEAQMKEVPRRVIHVERNLASFDDELINNCDGAVNSSGFYGRAARRVKCENLQASEEWDKQTFYWVVSADFIVGNDDDIPPGGDPAGWWYDWKLNAGFHYLDGNGKYVPFLARGGQRPSRPMLLGLNGTALNGNGTYVPGVSANAPVWLGFRQFRDADFNQLGLLDGV